MTSQHPHDPFRPVADDVPPHAPPAPNPEPEKQPNPDPSPESEAEQPKPKRRRGKRSAATEASEDELAAALAELDGNE